MFPAPIVSQRIPTTNDLGYPIGQQWVNTVSGQAYIMTGAAAGLATWALSSPGASDVDTINGLSPVVGNVVIAGGTNLTDVNGGNTITLNLDAAITLATSVTSPLYTSAAGMAITAAAANNIVIQMGDAAGATKVSFTDSTTAEVFSIDSNGSIGTLAGLTVTGNFAQTAGVFNVGQDNAANAINIGGGTTARAIGIGNTAAAHVLTLGSTNTTASTILQSGTTGIAINATGAASPLTLDSVGVLELNSSGAAIGIGIDAVAQAINIGTGAAARTVTVGNIIGATAVNVNTGTGGSAITTTNGIFAIATGTGAINVGVDAVAHTITLGNIIGATAVNINAGTGGTAITTTNGTLALASGTGAINIGVDAVAHVVTLGNAIGATSVVVNGGTGAMSFGANAIAHTTTVGSTTGVASTVVQAGTGDLILTSADELTLDSVGVLELNSSGAAIGIGTDANAFAVNVGTAGVRTVTVGSVAGASATVIQSGTGGITFTGDIVQLNSDFITRTGDQITFQASPIVQSALSSGAAPTGATGDVNLLSLQEGIIMEEYVIGAGQTLIAPRMNGNGLLVSGDLTNTEGWELNWGAARTNSRHAFTIGTSPAFEFELSFRIADMSGANPYVFGFRKVEANNAVFNDYSDYATIGLISGTSLTEVVTSTELNGAGNTITNTTDLWVGGDGGTNTLKVMVDATGNVTYEVNGAAPTASAAFQFDNADVIVPFIRITHSATPGAVELISMKVGFQP